VGSIRNVAVSALTKNVADELAASHITAVVVHPSTTRTEKTPGVIDAVAKHRGVTTQEVEAQMGATNLLGRLVDSQEVAWVVAFLCSPKAVSINGDAVVVGGGIRGAIHY
jgi:NAD(P)-dependent dehydrogenase (short-subunit alcohol dehydrogenase family)